MSFLQINDLSLATSYLETVSASLPKYFFNSLINNLVVRHLRKEKVRSAKLHALLFFQRLMKKLMTTYKNVSRAAANLTNILNTTHDAPKTLPVLAAIPTQFANNVSSRINTSALGNFHVLYNKLSCKLGKREHLLQKEISWRCCRKYSSGK